MEEVWKDIEDYEGLYQVSNLGNVRSVQRPSTKGGTLKQQHDRKGYVIFGLCKNGKSKMVKAHRMVAETFIPNPDNLPQVNHKDEDKTNNHVENLEWCTNRYNANYGTKTSRARKKMILSSKKKLHVVQYDVNGKKINVFDSVTDAAISVKDKNAISTISKCCKGRRKTAYGYIWKYK